MTLAYRRVGAGEPLLLLHGLGSQWQVWEPVLALLSRERDVACPWPKLDLKAVDQQLLDRRYRPWPSRTAADQESQRGAA